MQRSVATRTTIDAYLRELVRQFPGEGTLYLVGGSMLVYQDLQIMYTLSPPSPSGGWGRKV
jgi:hypothetical protein